MKVSAGKKAAKRSIKAMDDRRIDRASGKFLGIDGIPVTSLKEVLFELSWRLDTLRPVRRRLLKNPLCQGRLGTEKELQINGTIIDVVIRDMEALIKCGGRLATSAR